MNLNCECEHPNSGYANHFRTPPLHKTCFKLFQYRRKLIGMLVPRTCQQFQPCPRARATGKKRYKSTLMAPHLCAASSLNSTCYYFLKHSLGLYIYLLHRLGSLEFSEDVGLCVPSLHLLVEQPTNLIRKKFRTSGWHSEQATWGDKVM